MKRTAKKIIAAATIAAVSIQSVPIASACGGRSGGSSYSPFYGGYARAASNYRTTLPATPPIHNAAPTYNPVYGQPIQNGFVPASAPTTVAAVQPRPRAQVAMQVAAATQSTSGSSSAIVPAPISAVPTASQANATNASTPAAADVESSALAALASLVGSQEQPATAVNSISQPISQAAAQPTTPQPASAQTPGHIGSFRATLPSNVTIELNLNGGNTFSWVVRNNGQTSQFAGQYRITEGRLTLVRSNDLQQMAGKLTAGADGFTFQLDGANNGGLEFKRV